jgi:hypothetical protein
MACQLPAAVGLLLVLFFVVNQQPAALGEEKSPEGPDCSVALYNIFHFTI